MPGALDAHLDRDFETLGGGLRPRRPLARILDAAIDGAVADMGNIQVVT
jgi:hypothetical protein